MTNQPHIWIMHAIRALIDMQVATLALNDESLSDDESKALGDLEICNTKWQKIMKELRKL